MLFDKREHLGSRIGFLLLSAGCAIGVGNVWKFPWMVGQYGGGAFVFVYIIFLIIMGVPIMTMEYAVGRASQTSPVKMYEKLVPEKKLWRIHSIACLIGNFILMMFYMMVAGWIFYYFINTAFGKFDGMNAESISSVFGSLCESPKTLVSYTLFICAAAFIILSFSLEAGLERVTKFMMIALIAIMILVAVKGVTMEGAVDGIKFYLLPDFSKITIDVIVAAMNQAFFTLSIGIGSIAIFGSYINKEKTLAGESLIVICLDTFVAIISGFIIFPACFTYGVNPGAGPSLIFDTLPNIFVNMKFGRFWGSLFFLFLTFAAFSTVLAVCENIVAMVKDLTNWKRNKVALVCGLLLAFLCIPACLGFNVWSNIHLFGNEKSIMDAEDFVVSNILLPLGGFAIVLFCTWKFGWGYENFLKEANTGNGVKFPKAAYWYCKFVLPIIILVIFILGVK